MSGVYYIERFEREVWFGYKIVRASFDDGKMRKGVADIFCVGACEIDGHFVIQEVNPDYILEKAGRGVFGIEHDRDVADRRAYDCLKEHFQDDWVNSFSIGLEDLEDRTRYAE